MTKGKTGLEKYSDELQAYAALKSESMKKLEDLSDATAKRIKIVNDTVLSSTEYGSCTNDAQRKACIAKRSEATDTLIRTLELDINKLNGLLDVSSKMLSYWKRAVDQETAYINAK